MFPRITQQEIRVIADACWRGGHENLSTVQRGRANMRYFVALYTHPQGAGGAKLTTDVQLEEKCRVSQLFLRWPDTAVAAQVLSGSRRELEMT